MEREFKGTDALNTFILYGNKEYIPKDYKFIQFHIKFDVKYDSRIKARLDAGGHLTNADTSEIYSEVVSIEHKRFILLLVDLNDLEVIAADTVNVYLHG